MIEINRVRKKVKIMLIAKSAISIEGVWPARNCSNVSSLFIHTPGCPVGFT
jgi:hypothetical protein